MSLAWPRRPSQHSPIPPVWPTACVVARIITIYLCLVGREGIAVVVLVVASRPLVDSRSALTIHPSSLPALVVPSVLFHSCAVSRPLLPSSLCFFACSYPQFCPPQPSFLHFLRDTPLLFTTDQLSAPYSYLSHLSTSLFNTGLILCLAPFKVRARRCLSLPERPKDPARYCSNILPRRA